jgi:hypothetical protein
MKKTQSLRAKGQRKRPSRADIQEEEADRNFRMAYSEKEAERRAAWGAYAAFMGQQEVVRVDGEFRKSLRRCGSEDERRALIKRYEKERRLRFPPTLVIG